MRTLYVSGQVGQSADLRSQSKEAFANLEKQLAAAGATAGDVVKLTTYLVDYSPEKVRDAFAGQPKVFTDREHPPANTLLGVTAHVLMEVEAIALVLVE